MQQRLPSSTLCTALSAIPFVSDLCGVDVQWFQREIFTGFAEFQGIVSVNELLVSSRVPGTFASFSGFLVKFWFCTGTPGSIEWLDPAPRLRIGDCFEIHNCRSGPCDLCNQVTKIYSSRYDSANASSAWGPL